MARSLTIADVEDLLAGAEILGGGGGGDGEEGLAALRALYTQGRAASLIAPDELSGDALLACPYAVGSMTFGDPAVYGDHPPADGYPSVLAVRALAEHVGRPFDALICGEIGGGSVADALIPATTLGIPIVDADPVGRAVPEIEHSMFFLHGLPIAPLSVVNEIADTAVITRVADDIRAEALIRALAVASRNAVWVADHALPWGDLREAAIGGTITLAERIGRAAREAPDAGGDVATAAAASGGGIVTFRGTVTDHTWEDVDGFTVGETAIQGLGSDRGATYRIWFKNENLVAWKDDVPDVTCPDIISLFDDATGAPMTNPHVEVGATTAVVAFPSADPWRTPEGVALLGPRHFGFDFDEEVLG